jgi:hypothetical protein
MNTVHWRNKISSRHSSIIAAFQYSHGILLFSRHISFLTAYQSLRDIVLFSRHTCFLAEFQGSAARRFDDAALSKWKHLKGNKCYKPFVDVVRFWTDVSRNLPRHGVCALYILVQLNVGRA